MARYRKVLDSLRRAFPQPVSDQVHDAYFAFSILRALDQVDALKSQAPILGTQTEPDWESARAGRVADDPQSLEAVVPDLVRYLDGMHIWGHPRSQVNVVTSQSIASIIGVLLPSTYNPNLVSEESSRRVAEAEVRASAMSASIRCHPPIKGEEAFGRRNRAARSGPTRSGAGRA